MYSLAWQQGDTEQQLVEDLAIPHPPSPSVFTLTDRESQAMLQIESQPPEYESLFGVASQPVPDMATTPTLDMVTSPTDNLTPISPGYNVPYEPESEFNQQIRPYIQQVVQESLQQAILNRQARLNHRAMLNQQVMMMNRNAIPDYYGVPNQHLIYQPGSPSPPPPPPPRQMISVQISVSVNQWNSWLLFNEYINNLKAGFDHSHVLNDAINTALAN